jgi:hypothetical protein
MLHATGTKEVSVNGLCLRFGSYEWQIKGIDADLNLCMYLNRVTVEGTIQDMASRETAK